MAKAPKVPKDPTQSSSIQLSTAMAFWIAGGSLLTAWFVGLVSGVSITDELAELLNPASYQLAPNQNYCVLSGRERFFRKPGETRLQAPCIMYVNNLEGNLKNVAISFLPSYTNADLTHDLPPSPDGTYSVWRRKIYNGEVEQTKIFAGKANELIENRVYTDSTVNPGYMAYFVLTGTNAQQCGDNIDLSICPKILLGEVLWW